MIDNAQTDALIRQIYATVMNPAGWEQILQTISALLDCTATQIVAFDKRSGSIAFSHLGGSARPQAHLDYLRHYHRNDPRTPLLLASPSSGWMQCHHHIDQHTVDTHPFYQEFLLPHGGRYVSGCKLVDNDDIVAVLGVHRGISGGPMIAEELAWLDRLRSFMSQALAQLWQLGRLKLERAAGFAVIEAMPVPTALIDVERQILVANRPFTDWVCSHPAFQRHDARLCSADARLERDIGAAISEVLLGSLSGAATSHKVLRLPARLPGSSASLSFRPLRPEHTMGAFGAVASVMVSVHDPSITRSASAELLCDLFDLTPAEADVAIALSRGQDPQTIARNRRVSVTTVRSQVASGIAKLGLTRATDLALAVTRAGWL